MPVTSPRSSLLASGGSNFTTSTTPQSSITSIVDRSSTYKSYLDRTNNFSKYSSSSSSNSPSSLYYNYSPSNYLANSLNTQTHTYSSYNPRAYSTYRSLSGGSTGIGTYRNTNTSSLLNYDTNSSSRCGVGTVTAATPTTTTSADPWRNSQISNNTNSCKYGQNRDGNTINDKKPPSGISQIKRTSGVASNSSPAALARMVATSALDIYEKYSPANYKPNIDLSGSRSSALNEDKINATTTKTTANENDTYEGRCSNNRSSRYGRWYSQQSTDELDNDTSTATATATFYPRVRSNSRTRSLGLLNNSNNDYTYNHNNDAVTTATITLRSTRLDSKTKQFFENNHNNEIKDNDNDNNKDNDGKPMCKITVENSFPITSCNKVNNFNSNINDARSGGDIQWNYHGRTNSGCGRDDITINSISNGDDLKIFITK